MTARALFHAVFLSATLIFTSSPAHAETASVIETLRVPDRGIQPQIRTDSRGRVHMIYFKGDPMRGDIFYVRSDDAGVTFTTAIRVNSQPNSVIAIGTVRGPHIGLGRNDRVHVAWMGSNLAEPKPGPKSIPMLYSRLNDAGIEFEPQRNLIQKHAGLDGGGALAADSEGNVYVAWHAPDGGEGEAHRYVWISRSHDDGKTFEAETAAFSTQTGVCGCCGINIEIAPKDRVYILYRAAREMVNRDAVLLASEDRGVTFKPLITDPFKSGTCAMSTFRFAESADSTLVAWETQKQIRFVQLRPGDRSPGELASVPGKGGDRKHPAVAANKNGEFIVAWAEGTDFNKGGSVAWQVFDRDGKPESGKSGRAAGLPASGLPAVFVTKDGTFKIVF